MRRSKRDRRKRILIIGAITTVVALLALWLVVRSGDEPEGTTLGRPLPTIAGPSSGLGTTPPSASPTNREERVQGIASGTWDAEPPGIMGYGTQHTPSRHRVVITAGSDRPLPGLGWRIPKAIGLRGGKLQPAGASFRHVATAVGKPSYAQLYTYSSPDSTTVWCTITVDGKVVDHRTARGPWGEVYCIG